MQALSTANHRPRQDFCNTSDNGIESIENLHLFQTPVPEIAAFTSVVDTFDIPWYDRETDSFSVPDGSLSVQGDKPGQPARD